MNSNTDFLNTTIEFLPSKRFEESLFQARLQTSRLKKKERQKKGWSSSGQQNWSKFTTRRNRFYQSHPRKGSRIQEESCVRQ